MYILPICQLISYSKASWITSFLICLIQDQIPTLNYFFTPIVFITVGSYFIASAFFGVYAMAVDTLFLCFLEAWVNILP